MIKRTDAWKCSDGQCYESKKKAYNEEIKVLLNALPKSTDRKLTAMHMKKVKDEVDRWLFIANELVELINRSPKDRQLLVVKEFLEIVDGVKVWMDSAKSLAEQMKTEPDVETARSIAGQGG